MRISIDVDLPDDLTISDAREWVGILEEASEDYDYKVKFIRAVLHNQYGQPLMDLTQEG